MSDQQPFHSEHPSHSERPCYSESASCGDHAEKSSATAISDDLLAIVCGFAILLISLTAVLNSTWMKSNLSARSQSDDSGVINPLADWLGKPRTWTNSPLDSFRTADTESVQWTPTLGTAGAFFALAVLLTLAIGFRGGWKAGRSFLAPFTIVFTLSVIAYVLSAQSLIKSYNLEYALWALIIGLIVSNTVGTPRWIRPAVLTEFYIKTGLVLLGAEVLLFRLLALGVPGIAVAWVVTPIVLISTYIFGQKVLKMESRSLNMVISADMSVCGVSAAIAAAAACRAKKEELSLAIGISLTFTVFMMVLMPAVAKATNMDEAVAAAWMGGTIDSTGAVAAAGATLGDRGLAIASTVKMIQNILIGVVAFGIASYWVTFVDKNAEGGAPQVSEIWHRFPKFVIGFLAASILFSMIHATILQGPDIVDSMIQGSTKTIRDWLFCLAFISIGLDTRFAELWKFMKGGKPLILYLCGQSLNLILTLLMAYLMFGVIFRDYIQP